MDNSVFHQHPDSHYCNNISAQDIAENSHCDRSGYHADTIYTYSKITFMIVLQFHSKSKQLTGNAESIHNLCNECIGVPEELLCAIAFVSPFRGITHQHV